MGGSRRLLAVDEAVVRRLAPSIERPMKEGKHDEYLDHDRTWNRRTYWSNRPCLSVEVGPAYPALPPSICNARRDATTRSGFLD